VKVAKDRLNAYAVAIEDAQSDIREVIKKAYFSQEQESATRQKIVSIITSATKNIKIKTLSEDTKKGLWNFAIKQRRLWFGLNIKPKALLFISSAMLKAPNQIPFDVQRDIDYKVTELGVANQTFYNRLWKEQIVPTLDRIARDVALDPNDFTGRNSLRNLSEMEVRYKGHQDTINGLKASGVKLVVCSSHADCSDRCAKWQGRIYSLDGSSGVINGERYVPLEVATDHFYTTKAGRTYKNGLLGFNCRHTLEEYKGYMLPVISAKDRKKEYQITLKQRAYERAVRAKKAEAMVFKGINKSLYVMARKKAQKLYAQYLSFCEKNNRVAYPMRTAI
jgi:hypothetical protein